MQADMPRRRPAGAGCREAEEEVMKLLGLGSRILLFGAASVWLLCYAATNKPIFALNMVYLFAVLIWLECWAINEKLGDKK